MHARVHVRTPSIICLSLFAGDRSLDVGFTNMGSYWNSFLSGSRENNSQKFPTRYHRHVDYLWRWRCGKSSVSDILYSIEIVELIDQINRSHDVIHFE